MILAGALIAVVAPIMALFGWGVATGLSMISGNGSGERTLLVGLVLFTLTAAPPCALLAWGGLAYRAERFRAALIRGAFALGVAALPFAILTVIFFGMANWQNAQGDPSPLMRPPTPPEMPREPGL